MTLDLFAVGGSRGMAKVVFEIANGPSELPKLKTKKTAIAKLRDFFGIDHEHHVYNGKPFVKRVGLQINLLQVVEHAPQNLPIGDPCQKALVELDGISILLMEAIPAIFARQDLAAIKRIEKEFLPPVRVLH